MRADKPDSNKAAIVADLRERGYIWIDIGGGVDGIAIGYSQITESVAAVLVEIKNPDRRMTFTESEKKLQAELFERGFHGIYIVATSAEAVLRWFGVL